MKLNLVTYSMLVIGAWLNLNNTFSSLGYLIAHNTFYYTTGTLVISGLFALNVLVFLLCAVVIWKVYNDEIPLYLRYVSESTTD